MDATKPALLRQWIAIVEPAQSWAPLTPAQKGRVLTTKGLTGLDVRLGRPGTAACVIDCVRAGLPYRLHSWVGRHDGTRATVDTLEARRQARAIVDQVGEVALAAQAVPQSYGANAERDWWDHNGGALDALDAFAVAWHERTQTPLDYLGFASPAWHYGRVDFDGDGDTDTIIGAATRARFRRLLCMAYQDTSSQITATLTRARKAWPDHPMGAYVSIGAVNPREGRIIGRPEAIEAVAQVRTAGIDELTHYLGLPTFWRRMLLDGNGLVGPLVDRIPRIAQIASVA